MLLTIRRQLEFSGHLMKKECLDNLKLTGNIEGKRDNDDQSESHLKKIEHMSKEKQEPQSQTML